MKIVRYTLLSLAAIPFLTQAETITPGLWEVIGYPKSVQVSVKKAAKADNPVRRPRGTIDFADEANVTNYPDNTLIMNICIMGDNTWHEADYGTQAGRWSISGSNVSVSGNDDSVGSSGVLSVTVMQPPNGVMSGDWQQWPISAPLTQQDVFASTWTLKSQSCP